MPDDDTVKDLDKWKKLVITEGDRLDADIKMFPREVVIALARDPEVGPKISEAINKAMGRPGSARTAGAAEGKPADIKSGTEVAAAAIRARQEKLEKEQREEQEKKLSLLARIAKMDVGEKAKLAREGDQAARTILIKEGNKIISLSVLANPKITIQEIEMVAASRNVSEEVLREIGRNRDWLKSYSVVLSLANNPKTPIGMTLTYLPKLLTRDLRMLARSKGVPEPIRVTARKLAQKRQV